MADDREKLLGYVEIICRLVYGSGLLVSLSQMPSVSGWMLWPAVVDAVRGQIYMCIPRGI